MIKEIQRMCEDEDEAVLTIAVEVIEQFRDAVGTKRKNAKLVDRVNHLKRELETARSVERLTCVNLEVPLSRIMTSEA